MSAGQSSRFAVKRWLLMAALVLPLGATCLATGFAPWVFVVLFIATWPFPFRCSVGHRSLEVRWLAIRHRVRLDSHTTCELATDPRRWSICKKPALSVRRPGEPPLLLFGPLPVLRTLGAEVRAVCRREARTTQSGP